MANPNKKTVDPKEIAQYKKDIQKLEKWAIKHLKDKRKHQDLVNEISKLKNLIDLLERQKDGSLDWSGFREDVQEHSDKSKAYFKTLQKDLPFNWEQLMKEGCQMIDITPKKYKAIHTAHIQLKTELSAFYAAHAFYNQDSSRKKFIPQDRAFVEDTKKDMNAIQKKAKDIETYILPYLNPVKKEATPVEKTPSPPNSPKLSISADDYQWNVNIKGTVQWGKSEVQKFEVKSMGKSPTFSVPWNSAGYVTLDVSLQLVYKKKTQHAQVKKQKIIANFKVDDKGVFTFLPLKNITTTKGASDFELLFYGIKESIEISTESISEAMRGPLNNFIMGELNKQGISTQIIPNKEGNSIVISISIQTADKNIDLSLSPLDVGVGSNFIIKGININNTVASIDFKVVQPKEAIFNSNTTIQFEKENQIALDQVSEKELHQWWEATKKDLLNTIIEQEKSKNTPADTIDAIAQKRQLQILTDGNAYAIEITGFASSTGGDSKNIKIGSERAKAIENYLKNTLQIKGKILTQSNGEVDCKEKKGDNLPLKECKLGTIKFVLLK